MFDGKTVLVTGGTGSFGNSLVDRFQNSGLKEIRILSRDEKKQDDMRRALSTRLVKFFIGDVRNPSSLRSAFKGVDYVFHAAALKQVPSCEFFPIEAVQTNVIGTENVLNIAIEEGVKKVICLSTDKAVYPINAMGISKAMMEKIVTAKARESTSTVLAVTRYGNVMASRGSVIPLFLSQIRHGEPITITDPAMTRFMMSLEQAVDLVIKAFESAESGDIWVQKSPSATIDNLAKTLCRLTGYDPRSINCIGTRHGEKKYEVLLSREEMANAQDVGDYFRVAFDSRDLNYDNYFANGGADLEGDEYNSENTDLLDSAALEGLLLSVRDIGEEITWINRNKSDSRSTRSER